MAQRISFLVSGQVQGVGFRYFTRKRATSHEITGWVRNTSDEKVQGEAQGSSDHISKFVTELNKGPSHSSVRDVETSNIEVVDGETGFQVKR